MSSHILVTGFMPFSPLTRLRGNPSETVARRIGQAYGHAAQAEILSADANCLPRIRSLTAAEPRGILMFGAAVQIANCRLELEGATTRWGGLVTDEQLASTYAAAVADRCESIGMKVGSAPPAPFVYWCLRSYAEALRWAEPRKVPCAFVHLNVLGDVESQVRMASELFEMMAGAGR
jgi:hypothetical protein